MRQLFIDPSGLLLAYRDPLAWVSLGVDILPIVAVFTFGWGATPLVALYWLENLVIGAFTILRMVGTALGSVASFVTALFMVSFFSFHYGMFCFVHGVFLNAFATGGSSSPPDLAGLVRWAAGTAPEMLWFVGAVAGVSSLYYFVDFIGRGEYRTSNPGEEMFSPYGRIVTLHIAILLGAGLAFALDEPLLGVLLLIFIRVVFGVGMSVLRRRKRDQRLDHPAVPGSAETGS